MVTNSCHGNQKKGVLKTKNVLTAHIFPTYQSNRGREFGDGLRKDPQNIPFHGDQCVAVAKTSL